MSTRVVPLVLALALLLSPLDAQQSAKIPRVGFLSPSPELKSPNLEAFRQGLAELGYIEGKNIEIVPRFAEGQYDRFPALLDDLVRAKVDVLAVQGAVTAHAAKKVVKDIPMVFAVVLDPVKDDLVTNLERPGGNLTGVTTFDPQEPRKQFQLLQRVIPTLQRVALLGDAGVSEAIMKGYEEQALSLGLQTRSFLLKAPNADLEGVFAAMRKERVDALLIQLVPVMGVYLKEITQRAARDRVPTMYSPIRPDAGELLAYGTSWNAGMRRMAVYVDKILKGAKAGDLPVETLTGYELIVNQKTAREIGVTIPPDVLKRADQVIQ